jgi:hypothetical protein
MDMMRVYENQNTLRILDHGENLLFEVFPKQKSLAVTKESSVTLSSRSKGGESYSLGTAWEA